MSLRILLAVSIFVGMTVANISYGAIQGSDTNIDELLRLLKLTQDQNSNSVIQQGELTEAMSSQLLRFDMVTTAQY